MITIMNKWAV